MSLAAVVDGLATRLTARLGAGTSVGDVEPSRAQDLPAVTLDLDDVTQEGSGIGRVPRGTRTGALAVTVEVDLADPVLDLGGGQVLQLVPADRRSLVLPHGPLVRADGTPDEPFRATDLDVRDTAAWTVVASPPTGRQVRPDVRAGLLRFGQPLPASGTLRVRSHIGQWDVVVSRYRGNLGVRVTADGTALRTLVRRVAEALDERQADVHLVPRSWAGATRPAGSLPDQARVQRLGYLVDAELEHPLLPSGGGVLTEVAVTLRAAEHGETRTETFDVALSR